jgi:hypothetical protein
MKFSYAISLVCLCMVSCEKNNGQHSSATAAPSHVQLENPPSGPGSRRQLSAKTVDPLSQAEVTAMRNFINEMNGREDFDGESLAKFVRQMPQETLRFAMALTPGKNRNVILRDICRWYTVEEANDVICLLHLLDSSPHDEDHLLAKVVILSDSNTFSSHDALNMRRDFSSDEIKTSLLKYSGWKAAIDFGFDMDAVKKIPDQLPKEEADLFWDRYGLGSIGEEQDMTKNSQFILSHTEIFDSTVIVSMLENAAKSDPEAMGTFYANHEYFRTNPQAIQPFVAAWASSNHTKAATWITGMDQSIVRDYAAQALVLKYINEGDTIEAAKWAGMIEDEQLSKRMKIYYFFNYNF